MVKHHTIPLLLTRTRSTIPLLLALSILLGVLLAGCKERNSVEPPSEQEVITTVIITLTQGDAKATEFLWEDIDGVGGNPPNRIDTIRIAAGMLYSGSLQVENQSVDPAVSITTEIETLRDQHEFFFTITNGVATIVPTDTDSRGLPLGLKFTLTAATIGKGSFTAALSHWASATAKDGTTPSDETDISVTLPIVVE